MDNQVSLRVYFYKGRSYISASELFETIFPNSYTGYPQWVRINITHQPQNIPIEGTDYVNPDEAKIKVEPKIKGGKTRVDYLISTLFAIQLCYQAKTLPAKSAREFLYKLG